MIQAGFFRGSLHLWIAGLKSKATYVYLGSFYPIGKKPKGYCDDHRVCLWTFHTFRTTGCNSGRIFIKLGMMNGHGSVMCPIVWCHGPVTTFLGKEFPYDVIIHFQLFLYF